MHSKQIFQTSSSNRWKMFKWASRVLFLAIFISIVCVVITIASKKYPSLPDLSNYVDNQNVKHQVYFIDAATNFNIMRKADDWGVGGVALWRLGSEDPRLWNFFRRDLTIEALSFA